jgi:hypothetical protein
MEHTTEELGKMVSPGVMIMGLFLVGFGLFLTSQSSVQSSQFGRWQAAPLVREAGELQTIGSGSDVVIVGSIDLENPVSAEGFVVYDYWEERRDSLDHGRRSWESVSANKYRPAFQLLLGSQAIVIQSWHAALHNTQTASIGISVKLQGFSLGERVTVFGTLVSPDEPFEVDADVICGGGNEECLEGFSGVSTSLLTIAVVMVLVGGGLTWAGARKSKTPPNEVAA